MALGLPVDSREYGIGAQILVDLGITTMRLHDEQPVEVRRPRGIRPRDRRTGAARVRPEPREHRLPAHQAREAWATSSTGSTESAAKELRCPPTSRPPAPSPARSTAPACASAWCAAASTTTSPHGCCTAPRTHWPCTAWPRATSPWSGCPGAYEIPLAAKALVVNDHVDAVVCLGAVIRGETPHYDFVAGECARGIQDVQLDTGSPVVFGVLTTENLEQALARSSPRTTTRARSRCARRSRWSTCSAASAEPAIPGGTDALAQMAAPTRLPMAMVSPIAAAPPTTTRVVGPEGLCPSQDGAGDSEDGEGDEGGDHDHRDVDLGARQRRRAQGESGADGESRRRGPRRRHGPGLGLLGDPELLGEVSVESVDPGELLGDLTGQPGGEPLVAVDRGQLDQFSFGNVLELPPLLGDVGLHRSRVGLLTDTYSPRPIDRAPATSAAIPAVSTTVREESAAATPRISAAVDTMPSLAPITDARSQPERWL